MTRTTIHSDYIPDNAITGVKIAENSITAREIATNAITTLYVADDSVTADKLANSINTDIATANTTANAALPKAGGTMTGVLNMGSQNITNIAKVGINNAPLSGSQVYIKKLDGSTNLQRWGEGTNSDSQDSYRFRIDQNYKFIANSGSGDNIILDSATGKVGIGETSPETSLHIKNAGNSFLTLERSGTTGGTGKFGINMEGGSSQQTTMAYDDGGKLVIGRSSDPATQAGFSNDFVLDSSGNFGIGTATIANESDHKKLKISGASGTGAGIIEFADGSNNIDGAIFSDDGNLFIVADRDNATASSSIRFRVDGSSEKMRIISTGEVGIGTTPATHYTGYEVLDIGDTLSLMSNNSSTNVSTLTNNGYLNSNASNWVRKYQDESTMYSQVHGDHRFSTAVSGSAGGAITWLEKFRIDSSGDVGIGFNNAKVKLEVATVNAEMSHFGGINGNNGQYTGITLGYREANLNYRKTGIVQQQLGDGAARGHLHLCVDTGADAGSINPTDDSKLMINGITGGISLTGNHQFNFRANGANNPGNGGVIKMDNVAHGNAAGCYSTSSGLYQAAITGWYMISVGIRYDSISGSANQYARPQLRYLADGSSTWIYPVSGGWIDPIIGVDFGTGDYIHTAYSVPMYLANGDNIGLLEGGNATSSINHDESHFGVIFMG